MNEYEARIDPTDFGTMAGYLRHPQSPIDCLLHVRDRSMLAPLAENLERALQRESGPAVRAEVRRLLDDGLKKGDLLISPRRLLPQLEPRQYVDASTVPAKAGCEVLYLPPFYLVHTPGLFEGTLKRREPCPRPQRQTKLRKRVQQHRMTM